MDVAVPPPPVPPSGERHAVAAAPPVPPSGERHAVGAAPPVPPSGERTAIAPPEAAPRESDVALPASFGEREVPPALRTFDPVPASDRPPSRRKPRERPRSTEKTRPPVAASSSPSPATRRTPRRRGILWLILLMLALGAGAMAAAYFWPDLGL
jgi:hypothetical protein